MATWAQKTAPRSGLGRTPSVPGGNNAWPESEWRAWVTGKMNVRGEGETEWRYSSQWKGSCKDRENYERALKGTTNSSVWLEQMWVSVKDKAGGQDNGQAIKSLYIMLRMGPWSHEGRLSKGITAVGFYGENSSSCPVREKVGMEGSRAVETATVVTGSVQDGADLLVQEAESMKSENWGLLGVRETEQSLMAPGGQSPSQHRWKD